MNPILRAFAPFVVTPAMLISMTFERMPYINRLGTQMRKDLAAGGAVAQLARAKQDMGIAMAGLAWTLASAGVITGTGPLKKEYREMWETQKRLPNSLRVPGTDYNVQFQRFSPWSMFFGTIADIQQLSHEMPEWDVLPLIGATIVAFGDQVLAQSFLQGPAEMIKAIDEARINRNFKALEKWAQQQAGTVIPTGVATISRALDPAKSEVATVADALRHRTRGFSMEPDIPIRHDFFNQPMTFPHSGVSIVDAINPFYVQEETADEKIKAIVAAFKKEKVGVTGPALVLGGADEESGLNPTPNEAKNAGEHLTPKQHNAFIKYFNTVEIGGANLKDSLYSMVTGRDTSIPWKELGPKGKQMAASGMIGQFKKLAEQELLDHDPALAAKVETAKRQRMNLILPGAGGDVPTPKRTGGVLDSLIRSISP